MLRLSLAYMRDRLGSTLLNMVLLALAVASLVVLMLVSQTVTDRFRRDAEGVDLVVGAKGSPLQLILSAVYQLDAPTGNIPLDTLDLLRRDPMVARAIPLALGDNFRGFRIVGTEPSFVGLKGGAIAAGRMWAAPYEVVVGAAVAKGTGAGIGQKFVGSHGLGEDGDGAMGHDHAPFVVTGVLKPTGTMLDRLILTSVESVWGVHGIAAPDTAQDHDGAHQGPRKHLDQEDHVEDEGRPLLAGPSAMSPEITAVLVSYRSPAAAIRLPAAINRQTALQAAVPAAETARFLTLFEGAIAGARLFGWLIAGAGALSIFTVLLAAARGREGDMALLRVMGATRGQVFGMVFLEGILTALAGGLLGLGLAHLLLEAAARSSFTLSGLGLGGGSVHAGELAILGGAVLLGALAGLIPAARVFGQDLAATLARAQ